MIDEIFRISSLMELNEGRRPGMKKFQFIIDQIISELKIMCENNEDDNINDRCNLIKLIDRIKIFDITLGTHKKYIILSTLYHNSDEEILYEFLNHIIDEKIHEKIGISTEMHNTSVKKSEHDLFS